MANIRNITVRGARQHNLKSVNVEIPRNRLTVITGLSGSGKSSLAFDTIYAEGQRRYVESLSAYARQFLDRLEQMLSAVKTSPGVRLPGARRLAARDAHRARITVSRAAVARVERYGSGPGSST